MFSHPFPFDPTCGYDLAALRHIGPAPEPADFTRFWQDTFAEAASVPLAMETGLSTVTLKDYNVANVSFNSLGSVRIHGWIIKPKTGPVTRGLVIGHGYGERIAPDDWLPVPQAAAIFPCTRGLGLSRLPGVPDVSTGHVLHGIEARETYIHRGCAADVWAAASALIASVPECAAQLDYIGGSFGGGIGALALPWDRRFHRAFLSLPSFGQHPLRLTLPCAGSGEAVRHHAQTHPEVAGVLAYFDASVAATHLRLSTMVVPARFDPFVPPPGQFAVANAIPKPNKAVHVRDTGHFEYPGLLRENLAEHEALVRFLNGGADLAL